MLESVFNKVAGLRACYFFKKKLQHRCFPVKFAKSLRTPIFKNIFERLLLYFHYNSDHHYHYHHFQYHCKMHLYCLGIFLTIPLDFNMIPCLFHLNFVFFLVAYFFSLVWFQAFRFSRPVNGLRIRLRPPDKFQMFFLYLYLYL